MSFGPASPDAGVELLRQLFLQSNELEARQVFFMILMIQSHERSIKPFTATSGLLGQPCPIKVNY